MAEQVRELVGTETASMQMSPIAPMKAHDAGLFDNKWLWVLVAVVVVVVGWMWWKGKKRASMQAGMMPNPNMDSQRERQMDMQQQMQMLQLQQQEIPAEGVGYMPETDYYPKTYNGWGTY
jgi:hypothetical protein